MEDNVLLKEYEIALDLKRPIPMRPFEVVEGDTGNRFTITVTDDGEPVTLDDYYVLAVFSNTLGIAVQSREGGNLSVDGSKVTLDLSPDSIAPGLVECELQIFSSTQGNPSGVSANDVLVTTARFNFSCRRAILCGDSINASPQFPLLSQTIAEIEEAEAGRTECENARAAAEEERQTAEEARAAAEQARAAAENMRASAESARLAAEEERIATFALIQAAEGEFAAAEEERAASEEDREEAETARASAETARANGETARATAETARATAETARANGETARANAESARVTAENARAAAESARATDFAAMMASAGAMTGSAEPTEATAAGAGRLYYASDTGTVFVCLGMSSGTREYDWRPISYNRPWHVIKTVTLDADATSITIDKNASGASFLFDELRLTMLGTMTGSAGVKAYLNGETASSIYFATFTNLNASNASGCVALLKVEERMGDVAVVKKYYGGNSDGSGLSISKGSQTGFLRMTGLNGYSAIKLECSSSSGRFPSGTVFTLEGRKKDTRYVELESDR